MNEIKLVALFCYICECYDTNLRWNCQRFSNNSTPADFSDEELYTILIKSDEWGEFDYVLAKKILQSRGKEINEEMIQLHKKQRIEDLAKTDESLPAWIYMGYASSFLGGLFGVFIG